MSRYRAEVDLLNEGMEYCFRVRCPRCNAPGEGGVTPSIHAYLKVLLTYRSLSLPSRILLM